MKYTLQPLQNGESVFIARDVPALGAAEYTIIQEAVDAPAVFKLQGSSLSNGLITISWDPANGSITHLVDKGGHDHAGRFGGQGLNSYWYVKGIDPTAATSNDTVQVKIIENGPVMTVIAFASSAPGVNRIEKRITLYAGEEEVLIENVINKRSVREKEAVHFGFPFNTGASQVTVDAGYGTTRYLTDQLPGSNMDFLYGRRWLDISGNGSGLQWMLLETPMVEPGNMTDERKLIRQSHKEWRTSGQPTTTWFSYVMNNYWHTNYKADQEGVTRFRYALRPHGTVTAADIEKSRSSFYTAIADGSGC